MILVKLQFLTEPFFFLLLLLFVNTPHSLLFPIKKGFNVVITSTLCTNKTLELTYIMQLYHYYYYYYYF